MKRKTMSIAAAALVALAVLPATASAGEFPIHCEMATCNSTILGGHTEISGTVGGIGYTCTSSTGTTSRPNNSSTGAVQFTFHGCKDTFLGGSCTSAGQPAGTIKTNALTTHSIYLDPEKTTPGLLITGFNVTITCAFAVKKTLTGSLVGHWNSPNCGVTQNSHAITFATESKGHQRFKQVTTAGPVFDLVWNDDAGGSYETVSVAMGTTLTHATKTAFTC